jgi:hypothetical protein
MVVEGMLPSTILQKRQLIAASVYRSEVGLALVAHGLSL